MWKIIYYGLLLTSAATLFIFRKRLPASCRWFLPLLLLSFTVQVINDILKGSWGDKSVFVFHIYQPLEFMFLCLFYYEAFTKPVFKQTVIFFSIGFFVFCGMYYFFNQANFFEDDFMDFSIQSVLVCILVVLYFLNMLEMREKIDLKHFPTFWLNALHLIFYGGCLFAMGLHFYLTKIDPSLAKEFLKINNFLNLFLYAGYSITFSCTKTARK